MIDILKKYFILTQTGRFLISMILTVVFLLGSILQDQKISASIFFSKCIKEDIIKHEFELLPDSTVRLTEFAEQWKSPSREKGQWSYANGLMSLTESEFNRKMYRVDTISALIYLIPQNQPDNFALLKAELFLCLKNNSLSQEFSGFTFKTDDPTSEDRFRQRLEYMAAMKCICGKDILVERPTDLNKTNADPKSKEIKRKK